MRFEVKALLTKAWKVREGLIVKMESRCAGGLSRKSPSEHSVAIKMN